MGKKDGQMPAHAPGRPGAAPSPSDLHTRAIREDDSFWDALDRSNAPATTEIAPHRPPTSKAQSHQPVVRKRSGTIERAVSSASIDLDEVTSDPDDRYWIAFTVVPGVGPAKFQRLLDYFGSGETAWAATAPQLAGAGMDAKTIQSILHTREELDLETHLQALAKFGVQALTLRSTGYPALLREVPHPPAVLYVCGTLVATDSFAVAVVGTRRATTYGRQATDYLVSGLARNKVTVVSGLALGIDTYAHQAALEAGGRTIAVLGCGLDQVYPPSNRNLARRIVEQGAVVSEFPLGMPPDATNFPARNRTISGLSRGTLVVEAPLSSGALITADFAADEHGREVFAVPGSIFSPQCAGTNRLLQDGAHLVLTPEDILEPLNMTRAEQHIELQALLPENETESALLGLLSTEPQHIDELARAAGIPVSDLSGALMMELKGMVKQYGAMHYVLGR